MLDHVTNPITFTVAAIGATAATAVAAVDINIDAAFVSAAGALVVTLIGALAKVWRASIAQATQLAALEAEVRHLRDVDRTHQVTIDHQERTIAHLSATIDILRAHIDREAGDGR